MPLAWFSFMLQLSYLHENKLWLSGSEISGMVLRGRRVRYTMLVKRLWSKWYWPTKTMNRDWYLSLYRNTHWVVAKFIILSLCMNYVWFCQLILDTHWRGLIWYISGDIYRYKRTKGANKCALAVHPAMMYKICALQELIKQLCTSLWIKVQKCNIYRHFESRIKISAKTRFPWKAQKIQMVIIEELSSKTW